MRLIEYIKGLRKGKHAHRIERDAMEDPFLADALEGFDAVDGNHAERIERLQRQLALRSQKEYRNAAAKVAAKSRMVRIDELEQRLSTDIAAMEESAAPIADMHVPAKKKKHRSIAVWATAAILLLCIATGGLLWLLDSTGSERQLTLATLPPPPAKEEVPLSELIDSEAAPAQDMQDTKAAAKQEEVIVQRFIPPVIALEEEVAELAEMEVAAPQEEPVTAEAKGIFDSAGLKPGSTDTSALLAAGVIDAVKTRPEAAIKLDSSTADRQVLSQGDKLSEQNQLKSLIQEKRYAESTATSDTLPSPLGNVRGRVVDRSGEPLIGATVAVKGTANATITDIDGYFALNAKNAERLVASYIGFDRLELPADTSKPMTLALNESAAELSEVVVIGHGVSTGDEDYRPKTPQPEEGYATYHRYLEENLRKPTDKCANVRGRVVLNFYINSSGYAYNIEVKRSLCPSADEEAIRLVREGGRWTTGSEQVRLSIKFE